MGLSMKKNGCNVCTREVARMTHESGTRGVREQIDYIVANFDNVYDLELSCVMEVLWYDFIGALNNSLLKKIKDCIDELVDEGKVMVW